jgi:hypothetical protein
LIKTEGDGSEQWNRTYGDLDSESARCVRYTSDGGYILTGRLHYDNSSNKADVLLIKTDSDGNEQWYKTFGGPENAARGFSVQQTIDGGYVIIGYITYEDEPKAKAWLIKTNTSGNLEWEKTFGRPDVHYDGYDVQQTMDGGFILTGDRQGGGLESWLIKTDATGGKEWELTLESPQTAEEIMWSVQQTSDGGYITAGEQQKGGNPLAVLMKVGYGPSVRITKPKNALYIMNFKIRPYLFRNPLILGPIDIEVDVTDEQYAIEKVEFYIDDILRSTDTMEPYMWRWDEQMSFRHTIEVLAYNSNGNVGRGDKTVWKFF